MNYAAKFIFFVLAGVVGSVVAMFADGHVTFHEGINVVVLCVGAALIFFKANTPEQPLAKEVIAIFSAAGVLLVSSWTDGHITNDEWAQIAMAAFAVLSSFAGNNVGDDADKVTARVSSPRYIGE
jgi:prepilin-type processing-associated H-X9-DG protein